MPTLSNSSLLSWITFAPLLAMGGIGLLLLTRPLTRLPQAVLDQASRALALLGSAASLGLTAVVWLGFDSRASGLQFVHHAVWIQAFNIEYFMGIDGLSITMVMLTALVSFIAVLASLPWGIPRDDAGHASPVPGAKNGQHFSRRSVPGYMALLMLLETAMFGVFCALDFFLFYVFWELMLLPMYFLIGIWGGPRKEYAAIKFFLYTLAGSVLMLLGMLALYFASNPTTLVDGSPANHTFNLIKLATENDFGSVGNLLGMAFPKVVWVGLFIAFAIKIPMFPFHTWLPDAHVEAPTPISVILAGILLKMGAYGILRLNFAILPEATVWAQWGMAIFGTINIVYAAFVCMAQKDLKKLIAYSSVSHMGFVLLGMAAFTEAGIDGAVLQMWNHGIISPALFLIAGVIYDRAHHREILGFGGLAKVMPEYTAIMGLTFMASLGLPGLNGFISEALCFLGAFPVFTVLTVISASAVIITAAYYLWTIQRMFLGPLNERYKGLKDLLWRERLTLYPLAALMLLLGFYPMPILDLMQHGLHELVAPLARAIGL
ncbi:MAG TPA: NADH-quinone oxidoreductase subunit M [Myxococcota bacterium]|nr:NADH-quinone oxidoreductase subunit M [Myxococcota bacterium]HRY96545.1 NADH-quinone oxidoreductase subunit M [Myxococcota bacterium]HSA21903.1 NADH-quinone oxidoreductase subunit M [Myxococcota bacterium]